MDTAVETTHELVFTNFRVFSNCNEFNTKVTESVLVHQLRPSSNNHEA